MSNTFIALLLTIGASTWIYSKLMRTTGNNTRSSLITAAVSGVLIFIVALFLVGFAVNFGK